MLQIEVEGGFDKCVQLITTDLLSIMYKNLPGHGFLYHFILRGG